MWLHYVTKGNIFEQNTDREGASQSNYTDCIPLHKKSKNCLPYRTPVFGVMWKLIQTFVVNDRVSQGNAQQINYLCVCSKQIKNHHPFSCLTWKNVGCVFRGYIPKHEQIEPRRHQTPDSGCHPGMGNGTPTDYRLDSLKTLVLTSD